MHLGRYVLSDGFIGYANGDSVLLPLTEVTFALDFPIDVDLETGTASGWFLSESRTFHLDWTAREITINGETNALLPDTVELHFDDIYVDMDLLSVWFPIDLTYDPSRLVIDVVSREPLPLEERLAREQGRRIGTAADRPQYPRQDIPYRLVDVPSLDVSTSFDVRSKSKPRRRYSGLLTGDLAYMDAALFATGNDQDKLSDVRFTLSRTDPDQKLLGPAGATEVAVGDVFTPQLPLIVGQREGRGASISSFPIVRPTEFDRTTLRGELPLGWEVELRRNDVLLDFQQSRDDGRYEFADVPLIFGRNELRLDFYGPQGQRRAEIQRINVGQGMARPGDHAYRLAINQQGEDTIPVGGNNTTDDPEAGKARLVGEYERGLTQRLSAAVGFATVPDGEERQSFATVGLRSSIAGAVVRLDAAKALAGGHALQGSVQTRITGVNLLAEHTQFFDFESERESGRLDSRSSVRLDGVIPATDLTQIPFSLTSQFDRGTDGRYDLTLTNRLSVFLGDVSASNTVTVRTSGGSDTEGTSSADGNLLANTRVGDWGLRGSVGYGIEPETRLRDVSLATDRRFPDATTLRVDVNRQLDGDEVTTVSPSLSRDFDHFAVGLRGSYRDDGEYAAGLTLSFGVGREPHSGSFAMKPRNLAGNGAASARVFLDRNLNDIFDEGDEPLPGVGFTRRRDDATGEDGIAFLTGLSPHRPMNLSIDTGTLEDPFWVPVRDGVELVPRPGKTARLDFAVVATGEIDGTVFLDRDGGVREVSNAVVQLIDESGAVVAEVRSEFDGFYLFSFVRPGRYLLRVSPDQAERLDLREAPPREVEIGPDGDVISGIDFTLERAPEIPLPALQEASAPTDPDKAGPWYVHLATVGAATAIGDEWSRLSVLYDDAIAKLNLGVRQESIGDQGTHFYVLAGPLTDGPEAARLCDTLQTKRQFCAPLQVAAAHE